MQFSFCFGSFCFVYFLINGVLRYVTIYFYKTHAANDVNVKTLLMKVTGMRGEGGGGQDIYMVPKGVGPTLVAYRYIESTDFQIKSISTIALIDP